MEKVRDCYRCIFCSSILITHLIGFIRYRNFYGRVAFTNIIAIIRYFYLRWRNLKSRVITNNLDVSTIGGAITNPELFG